MMDLRTAAHILGGEVSGRGILCPGQGHSPKDRSLSVTFSASAPDGILCWSHAGDDPIAAKNFVRQRLGLSARPAKKEVFRHHPSARAEGVAAPSPSTLDRTSIALRLWREAGPIVGSPGEAYFTRERSLDLRGDVHEPLRCHRDCPFAGTRTPAVVALVRDVVNNRPVGIHRTAIDAAGRKITVNGKDRLALGPIRGGAVKLTPDENVTTCLGIGEGVESTLSLQRLPEFGRSPVWSLLNAGGVAAFPVLAGVECLWVATDNDPAGRDAGDLVSHRWRRAGREVFLVKARAEGEDLNDIVEVRHG